MVVGSQDIAFLDYRINSTTLLDYSDLDVVDDESLWLGGVPLVNSDVVLPFLLVNPVVEVEILEVGVYL